MPFIPHTDPDRQAMLAALGLDSLEDLFEEIPRQVRTEGLNLPPGMTEMEISRLLSERGRQVASLLCFAGAGAYDHHIPAAVWEIVSRGEFYSSYTPYQAEASQGTLQLLYEYQSMITQLLAMDVSNASLYDGASALAEAILMAVRVNQHSKSRTVLLPTTLHPVYRQVAATLCSNQNIELVEVPYDSRTGLTDLHALEEFDRRDVTALVIPQPNYFGLLEEVDVLTDWAARQRATSIAVVNPTAMALLKPPGQWGAGGVDIACGDGQPLGIPLSLGGPYFGFMTCRMAYVRQLPGRIAGATVDAEGRPGFVLTLQAREQHIRRSKATSNICTNQGLLTAAATLYLALLGPQGLTRVATVSHQKTRALLASLTGVAGVARRFDGPFFHEGVVILPQAPNQLLQRLVEEEILGGVSLNRHYPELGNALLVCATETRTAGDIEHYARQLAQILSAAPEERC